MDASTRPVDSEAVFHGDDLEQVGEYRTVSALAIVSLVFGLLSPVCFAHPVFFAIPLFGAALSIAAIIRIDASEGLLTGRWAAVTGLVLCVGMATAAISRDLVMRTIRTNQAERAARQWLELVLAGETEQAFRLTMAGNRPEPTPEPGMPAPTSNPYDDFRNDPAIQALAAAGAEAEVRLVETMGYLPQPRRQFYVRQMFHIEPSEPAANGGTPEPFDIVVTMQRTRLAGEPQMRWLAASYGAPDAHAHAGHVH